MHPTAEHRIFGKVLRPRGLRGEIKVRFHNNTNNGQWGGGVFIDGTGYRVTKFNMQGIGCVFMKLEGIDTIEQAESLRDKLVYTMAPAHTLADDEVLVADILGFSVVDEKGTVLGTLCAVENYGASDVFDCGTFSFPNEDTFIVETNMTDRKIVIRSQLL